MQQHRFPRRLLILAAIFVFTFTVASHVSAENQNALLSIEELKNLKTTNPPLYREQVAEIKNQLKQDFQALHKQNNSQIEHFRKEFQKERVKYWQEKKRQYKETFQPYLNSQRNLLYRQLEYLEFRKPKEYADIMGQIEKNRPATIEELRARNEKFDRAKQRLEERDERIRVMTTEREQEQVAFQRRSDIVNKLRARDEERGNQILNQQGAQMAVPPQTAPIPFTTTGTRTSTGGPPVTTDANQAK